jgi:hypothetical protein
MLPGPVTVKIPFQKTFTKGDITESGSGGLHWRMLLGGFNYLQFMSGALKPQHIEIMQYIWWARQ